MDPIYLYADEIDGAYRITIGRTDEHVLTPAKNLLESPSEDLIDEIIYELQKFESLELKNGVIKGGPIEFITLYGLLCSQIDFHSDDKKYEPEEFEQSLKSDFLTNLSPGPEQVDQMYQWRSIISFLEERGYDFYKIQYYQTDENMLAKLSENIISDVNLFDSCKKSIFFNLLHIYRSPITSWAFTSKEFSGNAFATILSETASYYEYIGFDIDDDYSDEEMEKIQTEKKRKFFDECEEVIKTCNNFKKLSQDIKYEEIQRVRFNLNSGESDRVEFKQTLSLDTRKDKKEKYIEDEILKTIVAFFNKVGGTLIVGVDDQRNTTGIENEINRLYKGSNDKMLLHFKNIRKSRIGLEFDRLLDIKIITFNQKDILIVECQKSENPCYLDKSHFYVRTSPANELLEGPKLVHYVKEHFK